MSTLKTALIWILLILAPVVSADADPKPAVTTGRAALVVMDIQNAYMPYMDEADIEPAMRMINAMIAEFRAQGLPVIRVYHTDLQYGPPEDSEAFHFVESVAIKESDPKVVKNSPSAFRKTDLETILREKGCDTVFLCGLSATGCVLATYFDADGREFDAFMIKGGLISDRAELTDAVEEMTGAVGYRAVRYMLRNQS